MHTHRTGLIVLVGAFTGLAGPALAHGPEVVTCGQTLTHSVKLARDLTNCPGDGLVIGANRITVDLNGHTVDGAGNGTTCDLPTATRNGIANPGYDGVTVGNGTVQQFNSGVSATGMSDGRVHDLTLRDVPFGGVGLSNSSGNRVDHNAVSNVACFPGLKLNTGSGNRFESNHVRGGSDGIVICCGGDGNVVAGNAVSGVAEAGVLVFASGGGLVAANMISDAEVGIHVTGATTREIVLSNAIAHTSAQGIFVEGCCGENPDLPSAITIAANTLTETGDGIWLFDSDRDIVAGNAVVRAGKSSGFGAGVLLNGASEALVTGNAVTDSGSGIAAGIVVGLPDFFGPSPRPIARNVVAGNTINGQQADGIHIYPVAQDTTLRRNTTVHNTADGINVESASTTITRNVADNNAAFGIEAIPGVRDGGDNQAHGNGAAVQCTGVAC